MQISTILLPTSLSLATGNLYQLFLHIHRLLRADTHNDILKVCAASKGHWTTSHGARCNFNAGDVPLRFSNIKASH